MKALSKGLPQQNHLIFKTHIPHIKRKNHFTKSPTESWLFSFIKWIWGMFIQVIQNVRIRL